MSTSVTIKAKKGILEMEQFCRLKDELTYIGRFANKKTSKIIPGTIIQYDGKFYTNELPFHAGVSCSEADEEGMVTTTVRLFNTDYVPEECKPVSDCPIIIDVWETDIDDEGPIERYAFYKSQLKEAKEIIKGNKDVDIFIDGETIERKDFLDLEK